VDLSSESPNRAAALRLVRSVEWLGADASAQGPAVLATFAMPCDHPIAWGHYPGQPIVPGTCLLEAALQAIECAPRGECPATGELVGVEDLQLVHAAHPGEVVQLQARPAAEPTAEPALGGAWRWRVVFTSSGRQIARATLLVGARPLAPAGTAPAWPATADWTELTPLDIVRSLPHRAPLLLVDAAWVAPGGAQLVATRSVTLADCCYGLTSERPHADELRYPPLMVAESMAQAAGLLQLGGARGAHVLMLLGGARRLEFPGAARPGECLRHEISLRRRFGDTALVSGTSYAGQRLIVRMHDLLITVKHQDTTPPRPAPAVAAKPRVSNPHSQPHGALHHAN
jgi:3-hydroxyacyl-[acyl-carrier-protein] dehydratase